MISYSVVLRDIQTDEHAELYAVNKSALASRYGHRYM